MKKEKTKENNTMGGKIYGIETRSPAWNSHKVIGRAKYLNMYCFASMFSFSVEKFKRKKKLL